MDNFVLLQIQKFFKTFCNFIFISYTFMVMHFNYPKAIKSVLVSTQDIKMSIVKEQLLLDVRFPMIELVHTNLYK